MAVTVRSIIVKKPSQVTVGHFYQLVGKTDGGLPIPPQVCLIESKPHQTSLLERQYVTCTTFMAWAGFPQVAVPGRLDLWNVNIPPNGEAQIEMIHLGETLAEAQAALKARNEYRDVSKENPR